MTRISNRKGRKERKGKRGNNNNSEEQGTNQLLLEVLWSFPKFFLCALCVLCG